LTEDEYKSENMKAKCKAFDENVIKVLGKAYNPDDFKDNPWTLLHMICMRTMMREHILKYQTLMMSVLTLTIAMWALK
jgi:hypothetical protein